MFVKDVGTSVGNLVQVFVDAPLAAVETRDPKGLYKQLGIKKSSSFASVMPAPPAQRHTDTRTYEYTHKQVRSGKFASTLVLRSSILGFLI